MADEFVLYDDMQYTRRDWRNRNQIKTKDGLKWLSIPVEVKGKYFQKINETKISESDWGEKHWNTILHNYSKAKFFNDKGSSSPISEVSVITFLPSIFPINIDTLLNANPELKLCM